MPRQLSQELNPLEPNVEAEPYPSSEIRDKFKESLEKFSRKKTAIPLHKHVQSLELFSSKSKNHTSGINSEPITFLHLLLKPQT